jgi:hypothetical protein
VYIGTVIVVWIAAMAFTRYRLGDEAAAAKERAEHLKQRLAELESDKSELLGRLVAHGEDIAVLKQDLASRPRIFVGPDEPKEMKDGDLWFQ